MNERETRFTLSGAIPQTIDWATCKNKIEKLHATSENRSLLWTQAAEKINDNLEESFNFFLLKLKLPITAGVGLKKSLVKKLQEKHGLLMAYPPEVIMFNFSLLKKITKVLQRSEIVIGTMSISKNVGGIEYYPLAIIKPFKEKRYFFNGVESFACEGAYLLVREPASNDWRYNIGGEKPFANIKKMSKSNETPVLFEAPPFPAPMSF